MNRREEFVEDAADADASKSDAASARSSMVVDVVNFVVDAKVDCDDADQGRLCGVIRRASASIYSASIYEQCASHKKQART